MTNEALLDEVGKKLAGAENDLLQPACIARAFLDRPVQVGGIALHPLTMRGYLELESARSPFVSGGEPPADVWAAVDALCAALTVLSRRSVSAEEFMDAVEPEDATEAWRIVSEQIIAAWETALPMRRVSRAGEAAAEAPRNHGFGWWVRVLAKLITALNFSLHDALECPMAQAFALVAASAALEGMEPAGENWREREALNKFEGEVSAVVAGGVVQHRENDEQSEGGTEDAQNPGDKDGELEYGWNMAEPRVDIKIQAYVQVGGFSAGTGGRLPRKLTRDSQNQWGLEVRWIFSNSASAMPTT